ncbi:GrpB family protein [Paenibacillus gorillae]|uniref:GrpB family protein n=1 Tax=Paenibacillus gorillae TaxID=1243662 RepID=UPI0004AD1836|nr:GrpB family protein [Paenibacillus gorillae]
MRKVEVTPYQKLWEERFKETAVKLQAVLGDEIIEIHHIGSTSVPGLAAKPIIDVLPVVKDIKRIDEYEAIMREEGYVPKGENGISGRRYFAKGGDSRTHHIHIYEQGHDQIARHLAFRNYLRCHTEAAHTYGQLKIDLASQFPLDIDAYIKGKEGLASEIDRLALEWHRLQLSED